MMVELTDAFVAAGAVLGLRANRRVADFALELKDLRIESEVVDLALDLFLLVTDIVLVGQVLPLSDHRVDGIADLA